MSSIFGVDNNSTTSLFTNYFGATNSAGSSLSLGDYSMIKSGSYKKLLKKYYAENGDSNKKNTSTDGTDGVSKKAIDSTTSLLSAKTTAASLKKTADELKTLDYEKTSREDLLKKVKSFVKDYNTTLDSMQNIDSVSILQNAVWMTNQTKKSQNVLADMGISVGTDNKLTLDEKKFNEANLSAITSALSGTHSFADSVSRRASQIYTMSGTQALINERGSSYTSSGAYNALTTSQLFNSLL